MMNITIDSDANIITAQPTGKLDAEDFKKLGETIDDYFSAHDEAPSLLIVTPTLPNWDDFAALLSHVRLVRKNQGRVPKVAIVSDSKAVAALPAIADRFTRASIRHFPSSAQMAAKDWLISVDDHPGWLEIVDDMPDNIVHIRAHGIITAQDYEDTLIPNFKTRLKSHKKLSIIYETAPDFQSYTTGAFWDDARFGLTYLPRFEHIAIVTDVDWIRHGAKMFGAFIPSKLHVFSAQQMDAAKAWVGVRSIAA